MIDVDCQSSAGEMTFSHFKHKIALPALLYLAVLFLFMIY